MNRLLFGQMYSLKCWPIKYITVNTYWIHQMLCWIIKWSKGIAVTVKCISPKNGNQRNTLLLTHANQMHTLLWHTNTGYYKVTRRYQFYFRVAKQYFSLLLRSFVKYCFCHEKIKFISSSSRVMSFLLYRQKDIDKIIEGNDRNYVIDKLTCEIMENKPLGSRM